jgi:hypothetical protein
MGRFPLLEPQEAYTLAKSWCEHATATRLTHLRLVVKIAKGFRGYGLPILSRRRIARLKQASFASSICQGGQGHKRERHVNAASSAGRPQIRLTPGADRAEVFPAKALNFYSPKTCCFSPYAPLCLPPPTVFADQG